MNSKDELKESWRKATDSMVIQAATKDWDEYSAEAQKNIEIEVRKRKLLEIETVFRGNKEELQAVLDVEISKKYVCEGCKSTHLNTKTGRCAFCELPSEYVGYCIECDRFWALKPGKRCPNHDVKLKKYKPAMALVRLGNSILDKGIFYIFFIIGVVVLSISGFVDENTFDNIDPALDIILSGLLFYLYYFIFETLWQRTPAKFITGTKVITCDGKKPSAGTIALRTFYRIVPFEAFSFLGEKVYGWHDKWSGTYVVKSKRFENKKDDILNQISNSNDNKNEETIGGNISNTISTPVSNNQIIQSEKGSFTQINTVRSDLDPAAVPINLEKPQNCANCETIIGKLEKAYSFNGNIVCYSCSKKLTDN